MSERIEILRAVVVAHPKAFLTSGFESGVVALALGAQSINGFEMCTLPVDGKPVIIRDGDIFGAAAIFLTIVPVCVVTGTFTGCRAFEGAAKFLTSPATVKSFSIVVHGESSIAERGAGGQLLGVLGVTGIDGDKTLALKFIMDGVVNGLNIKSGITDEIAFPDGEESVGFAQHIHTDHMVEDIGGGGHLKQGKAGDGVAEHMILVAPIKLVILVAVLVGCGVNAQSAVPVRLWLILLAELVFTKGFRIVLSGVGHDRRCVLPDEGRVHDPQLGQMNYLTLHHLLQ